MNTYLKVLGISVVFTVISFFFVVRIFLDCKCHSKICCSNIIPPQKFFHWKSFSVGYLEQEYERECKQNVSENQCMNTCCQQSEVQLQALVCCAVKSSIGKIFGRLHQSEIYFR